MPQSNTPNPEDPRRMGATPPDRDTNFPTPEEIREVFSHTVTGSNVHIEEDETEHEVGATHFDEMLRQRAIHNFAYQMPDVITSAAEPVIRENMALTDERYTVLDRVTRKILSEQHNEVRSNSIERGEREEQYMELIKNKKYEDMSIHEILASDTPVHAEKFGHKRVIDALRSGNRINGASMTPDGRRLIFACSECSTEIPSQFAFFCMNAVWCAEHVPNFEVCAICNYLQSDCKEVQTYDSQRIFVCHSCINNARTYQCTRCRRHPIEERFIEARLCEDCINYGSDETNRSFTRSLKWVTPNETGNILKSKRMVSSEVEAFTPSEHNMAKFAKKFPKEGGISRDGSLHGSGYGFEVQTPRLAGKAGEEFVHRMTAALKGIDATVNESCGMHIHLDGKGITGLSRKQYPTALLQLWKTHLVFEDVMLSFLPYKRRANNYCRPMAQTFNLAELDSLESLLDAEKLWYKNRTYEELREAKRHHYHSSRYFGVNFHSLLGHGHLEIRYHSGTTNPKKILEWANLHALIMDAAEKKILTHEFLKEALATSVPKEKAKLLFEKIGLAESSRQYFYRRQKKFGSKAGVEADVEGGEIAPVAEGVRNNRILRPRLAPERGGMQWQIVEGLES